MIVADASIVANLVGDDGTAGERARSIVAGGPPVVVPDLVDVETVSVLRRRWLHHGLSDERFRVAVGDLLSLPFTRVPAGSLMVRAFELRANVTAYDACYVALAEAVDATLYTADTRLASAPGIACRIQLLSDG